MTKQLEDKLNIVRRRAEAQIEHAKKEYRRQMLRHRIDTANQGVKFYQEGKTADAVQKFFTYLKIVEDWKGCGAGELTPALFDIQKDVSELLLISGIYWDLAKVYDQSKTPGETAQLKVLLQKYVLFSKGMSYQPLCAETIRRYLLGSRPVHRTEIRDAYKKLTNSKCFVATALVDVTRWETLPSLRKFRDEKLGRSRPGRAAIALYYFIGPAVAWAVERLPEAVRRKLGRYLDGFAAQVSAGVNEESSRFDQA